ncbi:hypothetical protein XA26_10080 [Mycolicibacterium fortuitum]|uniref:Uncharacterized protein n=1 Tax=Mycolicibacterium fortuitum TaxID=1766 RepID=A0A0N9Y6R4_MYCFO|nr:hypothetical protein XA26_10080 [Mycolicibacterium fortuitum]
MRGEQLVRETGGEVVQVGEVGRQRHKMAPEVYLAASG